MEVLNVQEAVGWGACKAKQPETEDGVAGVVHLGTTIGDTTVLEVNEQVGIRLYNASRKTKQAFRTDSCCLGIHQS